MMCTLEQHLQFIAAAGFSSLVQYTVIAIDQQWSQSYSIAATKEKYYSLSKKKTILEPYKQMLKYG